LVFSSVGLGQNRLVGRHLVNAPALVAPAGRIHVVFVHGLFSGPDTWKRFADLLEADFGPAVRVECFSYASPVVVGSPARRVPEPDDIADALGTFLQVRYRSDDAVVLVGHSQGGLIIQRFLSRLLKDGKGRSLGYVKSVVLFACPNNGSTYFGVWRQLVFFWRHAQERQLRIFNREVLETQRHFLAAVVNATEPGESQCPLPVYAYGGSSDHVVPARVARGPFPEGGVLPGDHSSIVQPVGVDSESYRVLRERLLDIALRSAAPGPEPDRSAPAEPPPSAAGAPQLPGLTVTPPSAHGGTRLQGREREDIVRTILAAAPDEPRIHVLTGIGGSGKTRVAMEIAERALYGQRRVWWISASQISASMREVAAELGVPSGEAADAFRGVSSSIDLVWHHLDACPDPWILVFDNVDSPKWLGAGGEAAADGNGWIREPATATGRVVVTSRDLTADTWLPRCRLHRVRPLPDTAGAAMLMECAPNGGGKEQARHLSAELGGLPLALRAAAAYVNSVRSSEPTLLRTTITDFESYRTAIASRMASPPGMRSSGIDEMFDESIMAEVCGIALDLLAERGLRQAAPLLKLLACLNIAPIPYRLLLRSSRLPGSHLFPYFSETDCDTVLRELAHLGLVEEVPLQTNGVFDLQAGLTLHPVVHGLLRGDPDVQREKAEYYGLTVRLLLDVATRCSPDAPRNWDVWAALLPHAVEVARLTAEAEVGDIGVLTDALQLARLTARYLIAGGPLRPARDLLLWLIDNCASYGFSPDDREILALRHERGRVSLESGDPGTAETELSEVVAARIRVLGPDHTDTLASRHKVAKSVLEQFRWAEAERLLKEVVEAEYGIHGPNHSDTITVRHSLARARYALGRPTEVEAELRAIIRAAHDDPVSAQTLEILRVRQTLARCLSETRRSEEALLEIGYALAEAPQGTPDTPLVMSLRFTRCQALLMHGDIGAAEAEARQLLADRKRVLGQEHPETVRTSRLLDEIRGIPDIPEI
jgi:pimeloyl-ACP methyl ester carboxylesterase